MLKLLLLILSILAISFVDAQQKPCKVVKKGMTKAEVLKLCGKPTEIDTTGEVVIKEDSSNGEVKTKPYIIWHYGDHGVTFHGEVDEEVTANWKKDDELMKAFIHGEIQAHEWQENKDELNRKECK